MNKSLKNLSQEIVNGADSNISTGDEYSDNQYASNDGVDVAEAAPKKGGSSRVRTKKVAVAPEVIEEPAREFTKEFAPNPEGAVIWLDSKDIVGLEEGENIREELTDIKELAASIKANGIQMPLKGHMREDGKYVAVHGNRRTAALRLLEKEGVKTRVPFMMEREGISDAQRIIEMFITNDGKELTPLEKAGGVMRLVDGGLKTKEIAQHLGVSDRYVQKLIKLFKAPHELKELVRKQIISATYAIDVVAQGEEAVQALIEKAENGSLRSGLGEWDGEEGEGGEGGSSRITKKDEVKDKNEDGVNSFSLLKKYVKNTDPELVHENKADLFKFLLRALDNDLSEKAINLFFKKA